MLRLGVVGVGANVNGHRSVRCVSIQNKNTSRSMQEPQLEKKEKEEPKKKKKKE
jgi:hypothetical protein